uniref:DUF2079 domain-containing protein n=1 Tax=Caldilinea aerophila TaxID=133453 RepID=A0A7C1FT78_9CHLR
MSNLSSPQSTAPSWLRRFRPSRDPYLWALLVLAFLYGVIFTWLAWEMHAGMRTHRSDLGQIDQAIWNSSRGRLLTQTDNGFEATRLTDHVEPILVLISPIYWLWDDVRAILLLQAAAAAIGVLPLYLLALRRCEAALSRRERLQVWRLEPLQQQARPLAFALGVAYLLAPQLQSALLTEFHAAPLAVPLVLWAFWAVDARRWRQFVVAALLVASVKEEMALLAAGLGAWAMWRAGWEGETWKRWLPGALILGVSLLWFFIATFIIVPAHAVLIYDAAESIYFQRYGALGNSPFDILKNLATRPDLVLQIAGEPPRTAYLVGLLVIFAWLPVLGAEIVLLSAPLLLANLLSAYPAQYYGEFHYSAPLVAYMGVAAAYGLGRLWRWTTKRLERSSPAFQHLPARGAGTMALVALVQNARTALTPIAVLALVTWMLAWPVGNYLHNGRGPLGGRYDPTPIMAHHRLLERFVARIPPEARVTATAGVHPHVSHRRYVYQFPLGLDAPTPPTERAQWALLDVTTNTDMAPGDLKAQVDAMLAGEWGVVDAADGFLLLAEGAKEKEIPEAFYTFTLINQEKAPDVPLQLLSITAEDWPRWRQTKLVLEWLIGAGYDPTLTPPTALLKTPQQEVIATLESAAPPALVWRPPSRWQPGERVRVTTLGLFLPRTTIVEASGTEQRPAAIFHRLSNGQLVRLPDDLRMAADLGEALAGVGIRPLYTGEAQFQMPEAKKSVELRVWVSERGLHPGGNLDLWLRWGASEWPTPLSIFVHVRRNGETVAQADGAPRFWLAAEGFINDWRQVTLPADLPPDGEWTLAVGVYNPQSGARMTLENGKDELRIGPLRVMPAPPPDQACALIPQSCAGR